VPTGDALVAIAAPDTARGSLATSDRCFSPSYDESQLGLSLCRDIVVAHGGRPWVDPNREGGTSFRFTLPIWARRRRSREMTRQACMVSDSRPTFSGSTVLDFLVSPGGEEFDLPVILITGRGERDLERRAADLDVRVCLQKRVAMAERGLRRSK